MKQAGCEVPDYIMKLPKVNSKNRKKMGQSVPERALIRTNLKRKRDGGLFQGGVKSGDKNGENKIVNADGTFKRKKFDEKDVGKERIRAYGKKSGDKVDGEVRTRYGKKDGKNSTKEAKPAKEAKPEYKIKPKKLGSKADSKNKGETGKPQDRRKQKKEMRKKKAGK